MFNDLSSSFIPAAGAALSLAALAASLGALWAKRSLNKAKAHHHDMLHAALHDDITSLPNRKAFMERLRNMARQVPETAVIFLDLDGFKLINDSLGHAAGDVFLKSSALRLKSAVEKVPGGILARVGGDEFAIALPGPGARSLATDLADDIVEQLRKPISHAGRELTAGTSIGIAVGEKNTETSSLLRRADLAMYEAKRAGGSSYAMFDSKLAALHGQRERIINTLSTDGALAPPENPIFLPIRNTLDHKIVAARGIFPWPNALLPNVPDQDLLEFMAQENVSSDFSRQVLQQICLHASALQGARAIMPASLLQLQNPGFESQLEEALISAALSPTSLELQFPASQLRQLRRSSISNLLNRLSERGIVLSVTGFGDGVSDISSLGKTPFKRLVLHENLTNQVAQSLEAQRIIQGIAAIAKAHGLSVGAREVKQDDDLKLLRLAGISEFSGPVAGRADAASSLNYQNLSDEQANINIIRFAERA